MSLFQGNFFPGNNSWKNQCDGTTQGDILVLGRRTSGLGGSQIPIVNGKMARPPSWPGAHLPWRETLWGDQRVSSVAERELRRYPQTRSGHQGLIHVPATSRSVGPVSERGPVPSLKTTGKEVQGDGGLLPGWGLLELSGCKGQSKGQHFAKARKAVLGLRETGRGLGSV